MQLHVHLGSYASFDLVVEKSQVLKLNNVSGSWCMKRGNTILEGAVLF